MILIILIFISPFLWIESIILTKNWKHFTQFAIINTIIFILYYGVLNYTEIIDLGHDEYGLGVMFLNTLLIVSHILLGFVAALIIHHRKKKDYN